MKMIIFSMITIFAVVTFGCNDKSVANSTPVPPFFAQQREIQNVYMEADLTGKLEIVDGCIRLQNEQSSYLILWPRDFSLRTDRAVIKILDGTGEMVAEVGDNLMIGGGESLSVTGFVLQPLPEECVGPYWIVGNEIIRLD